MLQALNYFYTDEHWALIFFGYSLTYKKEWEKLIGISNFKEGYTEESIEEKALEQYLKKMDEFEDLMKFRMAEIQKALILPKDDSLKELEETQTSWKKSKKLIKKLNKYLHAFSQDDTPENAVLLQPHKAFLLSYEKEQTDFEEKNNTWSGWVRNKLANFIFNKQQFSIIRSLKIKIYDSLCAFKNWFYEKGPQSKIPKA